MDPNQNWADQLRLAKQIQFLEEEVDGFDFEDPRVGKYENEIADLGVKLSELVLAMNEWISKGGSRPAAWNQGG